MGNGAWLWCVSRWPKVTGYGIAVLCAVPGSHAFWKPLRREFFVRIAFGPQPPKHFAELLDFGLQPWCS